MKTFFKIIFKAFSYLFTGLGIFTFLFLLFVGFSFYKLSQDDFLENLQSRTKKIELADSMILALDLTRPVSEKMPSPFAALLGAQREHSFFILMRSLQMALDDPRVKAVYAKMNNALMGSAQMDELAHMIVKLNAAGKKTLLFSESLGYGQNGTQSYYLASAFSEIYLQPMGNVNMVGLMSATPFARGAFDKIGVDPDFHAAGKYKSAPNSYTKYEFTDEQRLMLQTILESVSETQIRFIADQRFAGNISKASIAYTDGPYYDRLALKAGLVDRLGYEEEAKAALKERFSSGTKFIAFEDYYKAAHSSKVKKKAQKPLNVAYIVAEGVINQDVTHNGAFAKNLLTPKIIKAQLEAAEKDDSVKAVLLRINSPGGDAVASESIRHAIEAFRAKTRKPVIVSMGNVAASGGYWIGVNADRIFAEPSTLTGSIGMFLGKFNTKDLWDKLGIYWGIITIGDKASFYSFLDGFNQKETDRIRESLDYGYEQFARAVAKARGISYSKITSFGEGRVWTGVEAQKQKLIDEIGGIEEAYAAALMAIGVKAEEAQSYQLRPIRVENLDVPFDLFFSIFEEENKSALSMLVPIIYGKQLFTSMPQYLLPMMRMEMHFPLSF